MLLLIFASVQEKLSKEGKKKRKSIQKKMPDQREDSEDDVSEEGEDPQPSMKEAGGTWKPGIVYKVCEEANQRPEYVVLPELESMKSFRHQWILRRRKRPMVPAPSHTPMPDKQSTKEGKSRLFSLYMRPWVLDRQFASRHVPHITDLDVVFDKEARLS